MRPQLLGYILDILVRVSRWKEEHGMLDLNKIPRMADWAAHCEIISRCMGYQPDKFLNASKDNAKIQTEEIMETSQVASCVAYLVNNNPEFDAKDLEGKTTWGFVGTASILAKELEIIAPILNIDIRGSQWLCMTK